MASQTWIQTASGRAVDPLNPVGSDIVIRDIAAALSKMCRFTGHTKAFYSVAQHSVLVSHYCAPHHAMWGLLHDASEAYLADIARPVKHSAAFTPYRDIERILQTVIMDQFHLPPFMPDSVREADERMLLTEKRDLMGPMNDDAYEQHWVRLWQDRDVRPYLTVIEPQSPAAAERAFLDRFRVLGGAL